MKIAILTTHKDPHGDYTPGKTRLVTGTTGALLEQARWARKNGHDVTWIGNCEDCEWEGVHFIGDVHKALRQGREWDIAVMHSSSQMPDFPARVRIVDCPVLYNMNFTAPWIDAVQCHSDFQRDWLCNNDRLTLEKSYVIPNGYDKSIFHPDPVRPDNEKKIFLYTSSPDRGLWHMFPIMDRLEKRGLPFELHVFYDVFQAVTGYWWAMDILGLLAREVWEGMKRPYVVYHGPVSHEELADWYRKADMLVYPCDPVTITETFCTTIVEALACGCVTLISEADVLPAYGEVAAMMPLPIDYDLWVLAVERLLDREEQARFRGQGLEWVKQFRWYRIAPRWEKAYKQVWERKFGKEV